MTLFNPTDLQAVFPEATPDSLQDPALAPYEALAERYVAAQEASGRLAVTGGTRDVIGELLDPTDPERGGDPLVNLDPGFRSQVQEAHAVSMELFGIVGEVPPALNDPDLREQFTRLEPIFKQFEALNLEPQLVLTLEHQPLNYWVALATQLADSPLNPTEPNPDYDPQNPSSGNPTRPVLRNGGLYVDSNVQNNWDTITNPAGQPPTWTLSILSGTETPTITNVTSYGYTDDKNTVPSPELDKLLTDLGYPGGIPDRRPQAVQTPQTPSSGGLFHRRSPNPPLNPGQPALLPLVQPDIHPTTEAYLTAQLSRIIQRQEPMDSQTWSWLDGQLPSGGLPRGNWYPVGGRVRLYWRVAGGRGDGLGVRPAGRG